MNNRQALLERAREMRARLLQQLTASPSGRKWCQLHTRFADRVVRTIYEEATQQLARKPAVAVVATGGYGRRELAPYSDIDITFIPLDERDEATEQAVRAMFKLLVDVFGALDWPVGYAYRLAADCPTLDPVTRSGLEDARLICGDAGSFRAFTDAFQKSFPTAEFLESKIKEREEARRRWNETPRVTEPNLRDGAGGLRDYHTACWIARPLGLAKPRQDRNSAEFLLCVRNLAHAVVGRKQDVFIRTRHAEVARLLNFSSDELFDLLIGALEANEVVWNSTVEAALRSNFELAPGVRASKGRCVVERSATISDAVVGVSRAAALGLRVEPVVVGNRVGDAPRIVEHLVSGGSRLRALDATRLLDRVLPEYAECRRLVSDDNVHRYTVGEHTLRVIEKLESLLTDPAYDAPAADVSNPRPLFLGALLHDLGKSDSAESHASAGAALARKVCDRLGVVGEEADSVVWLVREHLTLAAIARTHDLAQPDTTRETVKLCQRPERLSMLYLLTCADTQAVSPETWTPLLAGALHELWERTRHSMGSPSAAEDPALYRSQALRRLKASDQEDVAVSALLDSMPTHYLLSTPLTMFPLHADYVRRARKGELTVAFAHNAEQRTTEITICRRDLPRPGLLSRILGVIYSHDITLHGVRAASTKESRPVALDVATVSFHGQCLPTGLCRTLTAEFRACLSSEARLSALLRRHGKDPSRRQAVLSHRFSQGDLGVLEIETPLGRGMPYRVSKMLAALGWNVHVAKIGQWAGRATARFYIEGRNGERLTPAEVRAAFSGQRKSAPSRGTGR